MLTTTSSTGRRFFVTAEQRTFEASRNNLGDLALVF
jgi:hypothetical protein